MLKLCQNLFSFIRGGISLLATEILLRRAGNFPRRAGNFPRRASKSKLPTHDKGCLGQHFFWITFHFTSSVCLCVGYKMKTCTQISDYGFRGNINVVSPGDSAKRASPGRRACFSHVNVRLALLHVNTRLDYNQ